MSMGELPSSYRWEAVLKELKIGLLIGTLFGIFCGTIVYLLSDLGFQHLDKSSLALGTTVALGVLAACMTATTLGAFSPFVFARFRIDPAVASGPIVTAFNDVLSTFMFFLVARFVNIFF
jgi:magnesium transporter